MKIRIAFLSFLFFCYATFVLSQNGNPTQYLSFSKGEKLKFRVYYHSLLTGKLTAGEAITTVGKNLKPANGRDSYHIVFEGRSKGAFNFFYKVHDRFETFIDEEHLMPNKFIRRTREGGYEKDDDVYFHHDKGYAVSRTDTTKIPDKIQDIISAIYYARNFNMDHLKNGDDISIDFFLDDSVYVSIIKFAGREEIETKLGTFKCLKFLPMMATGNVFSDSYPVTLWVTDDKNHIPILAESAVIVGSVKMELIDYSGIRFPLTAKID